MIPTRVEARQLLEWDGIRDLYHVYAGHKLLIKIRPESICFSANNAKQFINVLEGRVSDLIPSQQSRINKLLNQLRDFQ